MLDVAVIDSPDAAAAALEPTRARVLAELVEPGSATTLAGRLGLPRQKLNYHVRALEAQGLVELVEVRSRRGCTERIVQASAAAYVLSPDALGPAAADAGCSADKLSARYLLALGARAIREVGTLLKRADATGKTLPTLSIETEIRFRSAAERAAFTRDLADAVVRLGARYHDEHAPRGRWSRLVVFAHPRPAPDGAGPTSRAPEEAT
ncbi:MAG: helix-turn-helix domain-containing protein [Ilumatobacteraceae bacterium]